MGRFRSGKGAVGTPIAPIRESSDVDPTIRRTLDVDRTPARNPIGLFASLTDTLDRHCQHDDHIVSLERLHVPGKAVQARASSSAVIGRPILFRHSCSAARDPFGTEALIEAPTPIDGVRRRSMVHSQRRSRR